MSRMRVTAAQILADCPLVVGFGGWGVLGSELPATGEHGPSVGYQWIDPIADANKEIWVRITTEPSAGTLLMWPDSSFEYDGPSTTFEAQLAVDAADVGTPQTVTVTVGAAAAGTLSAQEAGADTAAIAGAVIVSGALSVTESGDDTLAASGVVKVAGALSASESGADTAIIVPSCGRLRIARSAATASGRANCWPTTPDRKRPPRISPRASSRWYSRSSSRHGGSHCASRSSKRQQTTP